VSSLPNKSGEFLFSPETMARITEAEQRREYTLGRIKEERPEAIDEVLRLRGQWLGIRKIAKLCNLAPETVMAICAEYADQLRDEFKRRVIQIRSAADQIIEEILANPEKVPWSVKAPAACALYEKAELLDGRATMRIEQPERIDIFANWNAFIQSLDGTESPEEIEKELNRVRTPSDKIAEQNSVQTRLPAQKNSSEKPPLALPP
jgi:hypothetical protein